MFGFWRKIKTTLDENLSKKKDLCNLVLGSRLQNRARSTRSLFSIPELGRRDRRATFFYILLKRTSLWRMFYACMLTMKGVESLERIQITEI
jgi:hypothetical protein